jgi:hypothetical protein
MQSMTIMWQNIKPQRISVLKIVKIRIKRCDAVCAQIYFNLSQEMRVKLAGTVV